MKNSPTTRHDPTISRTLLLCLGGIISMTAFADTKIADNAANFGTDATKRTPDGVLEVVGGNANKPIFVARPAANDTDSGQVSTTSANTSFIIRNSGNVGVGTAAPAGALDVTSTTGAFVPPRMNDTQINALSTPPTGAIVYNTTSSAVNVNVGTPAAPNWSALAAQTSGATGRSSSFNLASGTTDSVIAYNNGSYTMSFRLNSTACTGSFKVQMKTTGAASSIQVKKSLERWSNDATADGGGMLNAYYTLPNTGTWVNAQQGTVVIVNDDTYTMVYYNFNAPFDAYRLTVVASTPALCTGFLNVEKLN